MSTTAQLERWATKQPLYDNAKFIGVFASDRLPDPMTTAMHARAKALALVVNYDPNDLPGSHWCAVLITRGLCCWFDSYGLPPDAPDIILGHSTTFRRWLSSVCQQLGLAQFSWSAADLQSPGEMTCGHYAVLFLKNGPAKKWDLFGSDLEANDALVRRLVVFT